MKAESEVFEWQEQDFGNLRRPMPAAPLAAITSLKLLVPSRLRRLADLQPRNSGPA